jgi:cold-inducible RNA-binding protein
MSTKLFVGGLSSETDDARLQAAFERFGELQEARVILDRVTGRSRGFGFVRYRSPDQARKALEQMGGATIDGRTIRVDLAEDRGPGAGREPVDPALVLPVKEVPAGSRRGHLARVASIVPVNGALMTAPAVNAGLIGRLPLARGLIHGRPGRGDVRGSTPAHRRAAMEVVLATVRRGETSVLPVNRAVNRAGTSAVPPGTAEGTGIARPRTSEIGLPVRVADSTVLQVEAANAASTGHARRATK